MLQFEICFKCKWSVFEIQFVTILVITRMTQKVHPSDLWPFIVTQIPVSLIRCFRHTYMPESIALLTPDWLISYLFKENCIENLRFDLTKWLMSVIAFRIQEPKEDQVFLYFSSWFGSVASSTNTWGTYPQITAFIFGPVNTFYVSLLHVRRTGCLC